MKDYYQSLGLPANASKDDIKHAHRRLSKKFHPDLNNGSKAAEEKFKEIQEAYELLNDDNRRSYYDLYNASGPAVYHTYPSADYHGKAGALPVKKREDFFDNKANREYTLKATLWFLAAVFTLGFFTYILNHPSKEQEIKTNKIVTDGVIVHTHIHQVMGVPQCSYTYLYITSDGLHKKGKSHIKYYNPDTMLLYEHFPVIYSTIMPEISIMLVTKEDFLRYGYSYIAK